MAGQQLKDLALAYSRRDDRRFRAVFAGIIADEEAKKHGALAAELRRLVGAAPAQSVPPVPVDRESNLPLLAVHTREPVLGKLALSADASAAVQRVLDDVKFGSKLEAGGLPRRNKVLLFGPPGCGKTSVAAAIGAELGRRVLVLRPEGMISSFLGKTAANLLQIFEYLDSGEYVLLIDEFDTIGADRDTSDTTGEMRRLTNSLLQQVEGYRGPSIILAATNRPEILDSALWRRFDQVIEMPLPSLQQIEAVIATVMGYELQNGAEQLVGLPHAAAEYFAQSIRRNALFNDHIVALRSDIDAALTETLGRRWA